MFDTAELSQRLDSVRTRYAQSGIEIVSQAEHTALMAEVAALGLCIEATRRDIASLDVADFGRHVPEAAHELEAIVIGTAEATDAILTTCEQLDIAIAGLPEACMAPIRDATTRIFEACSFQDLTGQRAAKVGRMLELIDGKVAHIVTVFSLERAAPAAAAHSSLLNGPQRRGLDQSAVDALFGASL